ncbi:hypothetical protein [Pleomorphovibrio marinus]|uniref:hypothetical protein n=1 Tax=Pleomorphovibrio marinus TaxID=2164132 RepID=UPI000E0B2BEE|nr:hypothetical protein [Pleomorphovibrio marinus]
MKKIICALLFFISISLSAQELEGAWKLTHKDGKEVKNREFVKIYQDGYFAYGAKELKGDKFLHTGGGLFEISGDDYSETLDFNTSDTDMVGLIHRYKIDFAEDRIVISGRIKGGDVIEIWEKISDREDDLNGNWVITGRKVDGETREMTPGARRTVKILGGGRFQWIAFNSETKELSGTGGGTYTAKDGKYEEKITFFSRDDSRVGASLEFDYEVKDGKWHHSGLSSTGNPIYEIWSPYQEAYLSKQ